MYIESKENETSLGNLLKYRGPRHFVCGIWVTDFLFLLLFRALYKYVNRIESKFEIVTYIKYGYGVLIALSKQSLTHMHPIGKFTFIRMEYILSPYQRL